MASTSVRERVGGENSTCWQQGNRAPNISSNLQGIVNTFLLILSRSPALRGDKVRMLTYTYIVPTQTFEEYRWPSAVTELIAHFICHLICKHRKEYGHTWHYLTTQTQPNHPLFIFLPSSISLTQWYLSFFRPNTGLSGFDEEQQDLFHKYQPVSEEVAEEGWKQLYDSTGCMHGPHCKAFPACSGRRLHILVYELMFIDPSIQTFCRA